MVRPNNASIGAAALNNRPLKARRGCELFPDKIDFGILKEGKYGSKFQRKSIPELNISRCNLWSRN